MEKSILALTALLAATLFVGCGEDTPVSPSPLGAPGAVDPRPAPGAAGSMPSTGLMPVSPHGHALNALNPMPAPVVRRASGASASSSNGTWTRCGIETPTGGWGSGAPVYPISINLPLGGSTSYRVAPPPAAGWFFPGIGNTSRKGTVGEIWIRADGNPVDWEWDDPTNTMGWAPTVTIENVGDNDDNDQGRGTANDAWEMVDCTAGEPEHPDKCRAPGNWWEDHDPLTTPGSHYWRPKKAYEVTIYDFSEPLGRQLKAGDRDTLIHTLQSNGEYIMIGCPVEIIVYDDTPDNDPPNTGMSQAVIPIFIHDNGEGAHRYDAAIRLLRDKNRPYEVVDSDRSRVDRLAGVSNSIMPRFFLGDPEAPGWGPSVPKQNNGGLRWLRNFLQ